MNHFGYSGQISTNLFSHLSGNKSKKRKDQVYGEKQKIMKDSLKWVGTLVKKVHTPDCALMKASAEGLEDAEVLQHECDCGGDETREIKNIALNSGIYSIINKLVDINNENTSDGFVTHLEIGMSDTAPLASQTSLIKPKARKAITQAYRDTTNAVFKCFFNGGQANSNSTTTTIGTSTSLFSVVAGTASLFTVGEQIEVGLSTPEITEISNIAGDQITVNPPLASVPSGGETVKQAYKELGLFGGSSANSTIGSGTAFARTTDFTARTKDPGYGLTVEWHIAIS